MLNKINRRDFLDRSGKASLGMAGGITLLSSAQSVRATPANEKIVLGLIGCGGRGFQLSQGFTERKDCVIGAVADVNEAVLNQRAAAIAANQDGHVPAAYGDFRKILDDKSIDAVVIATPDHWHALATVWACQAGKDVYVEKPPTHDCWEGQKMIEAARKYNRVVQCGFQNRSAPTVARRTISRPKNISRRASLAIFTFAESTTRSRPGGIVLLCPIARLRQD